MAEKEPAWAGGEKPARWNACPCVSDIVGREICDQHDVRGYVEVVVRREVAGLPNGDVICTSTSRRSLALEPCFVRVTDHSRLQQLWPQPTTHTRIPLPLTQVRFGIANSHGEEYDSSFLPKSTKLFFDD